MATPGLIYNWSLGKFAPNLKTLVQKMWSTRGVKVPRSYAYKSTPINKWPRGGPSEVKMELPIGFSKKGTPFEQKYGWTKPDSSGINFQPTRLVKGGAQFLPKGSKVGPRVVVTKAKAAGKPIGAMAAGGVIGYGQTKVSEKKTRGPKMTNPSARALSDWGKRPGINISQKVTVNVGPGPRRNNTSPFSWENYRDQSTGPKGGNKITMQKLNKKAGFKSPYASDIARKAASGYHVFKKGSKGAKSFRKEYERAKAGTKFYWPGTGKWYAKP